MQTLLLVVPRFFLLESIVAAIDSVPLSRGLSDAVC